MANDEPKIENPTDEIQTTKSGTNSTQNRGQLKRVFLWVFALIGVGFLVIVCYLAYLGFIPGLSSLFGANKPIDLGVRYTQADYDSYLQKTGATYLDFANAPTDKNQPGKKVIFADPKPMNISLTQEEITAQINEIGWSYMPIYNAQVKFSANDKIEISGNIKLDRVLDFINFIGGVGYSEEDVQIGVDWASRFSSDPAIYVDATGNISNNNLNLTVNKVKVGRWSAPISEAGKVLNTATINSISGTTGFNAKSVTTSDGLVNFSGTSPSTIYVKHD